MTMPEGLPPQTGAHGRPNLSAVRKGMGLKLKDGRNVILAGLYLSTTGPMLMIKANPSQLVCHNVPFEDVEDVL